MHFVDGCLGGRLGGGLLNLLADGAEGLTGGSCGGGGSLVHAPPGFVMQPLKGFRARVVRSAKQKEREGES